jgi:hypothetical protein
MPSSADHTELAAKARRTYTECIRHRVQSTVRAVEDAARALVSLPAESGLQFKRRELATALQKGAAAWTQGVLSALRTSAAAGGISTLRPTESSLNRGGALSLVDDDTIEREILGSRFALALMDRASWEFSDLRSRMARLEGREELDPNDVLRPHVIARVVLAAWIDAGLGLADWRMVQVMLHEEFAHLVEEAYHETNRFLIERRVLPEIDLRPFIRRAANGAPGGQRGTVSSGHGALSSGNPTVAGQSRLGGVGATAQGAHGLREPQTEASLLASRNNGLRSSTHAEAVLGRLNRLIGRQLPEFAATTKGHAASPSLTAAIDEAQRGVSARVQAATDQGATAVATAPALIEDLQQRKQALKQAATTQVERATIEIVALLFQSILTEERIPAAVRVWFARLQMPVLRVAVGEPDFFAAADHPARRLIDRMGSCVMGFDTTASAAGEALEKEIKRVVQVVEAYPDTGRRVFQTVLVEFEKFLENYFKNENEATRKGVSLAQQVEQRETLAIQYTIELRRMLNEVPVQDGVREFLFQVWADVLAMTSVKTGAGSEATRSMKRVAADLIWSASAKVSREERAEVIRRLPPLLKTLRAGMADAGVSAQRQDEAIRTLNNSLAAAFTAKAAAIPSDRLEDLMGRLEALEEMLPDAAAEDIYIDESLVLDLSGHESSELEVVGEGGSMPTPAMLQWARELQVGGWYMLDYRNANEAVQLAWQGLRRQLTLFVSPQGRGILFQQHRLAAFLQAGLLVPAEDESLTVRATRSALAKLDGDPSRLLR